MNVIIFFHSLPEWTLFFFFSSHLMENTESETLATKADKTRERFNAAWANLIARYDWMAVYDFCRLELARDLPGDSVWIESVKRSRAVTYAMLTGALLAVATHEDCTILWISYTQRQSQEIIASIKSMIERFDHTPVFKCTLLRLDSRESIKYRNALGHEVLFTTLAMNNQGLHNLRGFGRVPTLIMGCYECSPGNMRRLLQWFFPLLAGLTARWRILLFEPVNEPIEPVYHL
jgi:hypothetical protein